MVRLCPCGGCRRLAELEAIESAPWPEPCSCHRPGRVCPTHAGADPLDLGADADGRVEPERPARPEWSTVAEWKDAHGGYLDAADEEAIHSAGVVQTVIQRHDDANLAAMRATLAEKSEPIGFF